MIREYTLTFVFIILAIALIYAIYKLRTTDIAGNKKTK